MDQRVEVLHRAVGIQERMLGTAGDLGPAHDLGRIVQGVHNSIRAPKVSEHQRPPVRARCSLKCRNLHTIPAGLRGRDDSMVVDARDGAVEWNVRTLLVI